MVWMQLRRYPVHSTVCAITSLELINLQEPGSCQVDDVLRAYGQAFTERRAFCNSISTVFYAAFQERSCRGGLFRPQITLADQQVLLGLCVLFCVLLSRFLTHSWYIGMSVGLVLLSRGRLLTSVGEIGSQNLIAMMLAAWSATLAHFFRTGSVLSFMLLFVLALPTTLFDGMYLSLFWIFPIASLACFVFQRPLIERRLAQLKEEVRKKLRTRNLQTYLVRANTTSIPDVWLRVRTFVGFETQGESRYERLREMFQRGHYLRPLQVSFVLWVAVRGLFWRLVVVTLIIAVIASAGLLYLYRQDWIFRGGVSLPAAWPKIKEIAVFAWDFWRREANEPIDIDLFAALSFIILSVVFVGKRSFLALWEMCFFFLGSIGLTMLFGFGLDVYDASFLSQSDSAILEKYFTESSRASHVLYTLEPVVLTLGIISLINFVRHVDGVMRRRRTRV